MPLYIAKTIGDNPKIHLCIAPNKSKMKQNGMNMRLDWHKHDESSYKYEKRNAIYEMGNFYARPEDGITENTVK